MKGSQKFWLLLLGLSIISCYVLLLVFLVFGIRLLDGHLLLICSTSVLVFEFSNAIYSAMEGNYTWSQDTLKERYPLEYIMMRLSLLSLFILGIIKFNKFLDKFFHPEKLLQIGENLNIDKEKDEILREAGRLFAAGKNDEGYEVLNKLDNL